MQSGRIRVAAADGPPANDRPIDKALRMALYGNLAMVPLPQLLAWVGSSRRNGCLQIRHDKATTNLFFHGGRIVACSSDDPSKLLGQFLLYRGVIDEAGLCQAMAEQEVGGKLLGGILVEKGRSPLSGSPGSCRSRWKRRSWGSSNGRTAPSLS